MPSSLRLQLGVLAAHLIGLDGRVARRRLRDQLSHMRQCGFDSFAVREDKSVEDALKELAGMNVLYGRSVIEPRPLFRRHE